MSWMNRRDAKDAKVEKAEPSSDVDALAPIHLAQVISYLKATKLTLGLLITFNVSVLRRGIERVIQTQ